MKETGSFLRNLRLVLWAMVLVAGAGASWVFLRGAAQNSGLPEPATAQITDTIGQGDYALTTSSGQTFTQSSLKGQPSLVFFGFTHCPDVCPTTLGEILGWQEALGPMADALKVWFITVDPQRDTPEILRDYIGWLPGAEGVGGSEEEVAKALKAFKIYARKSPLEGGDYAMDHSAYVMLFDKDGRYSQIFSYQEPHDQVVAKLKRFLGTQNLGG